MRKWGKTAPFSPKRGRNMQDFDHVQCLCDIENFLKSHRNRWYTIYEIFRAIDYKWGPQKIKWALVVLQNQGKGKCKHNGV